MKVPVAIDAGISISRHFGRSPHSLIVDMNGSEINETEMRANTSGAHVRGRRHRDGHEDQPLSHEPIIEALRDCEAVICGGTGRRAANELSAHGIQPFVTEQGGAVEPPASLYLAGRAAPARCCAWTPGNLQRADA
jgi:predicted Fe-Mo cluster-binding NifX family protein